MTFLYQILEEFKSIREFFEIFKSDLTRWKLYVDVFVCRRRRFPVQTRKQRNYIATAQG